MSEDPLWPRADAWLRGEGGGPFRHGSPKKVRHEPKMKSHSARRLPQP